MKKMSSLTNENPIAIIGAGPVGLTLAIALCQHGFQCTLISRDRPEPRKPATFDGRAYSIAAGCWNTWKALGLEETLKQDAQPVLTVEAEAAGFAPLIVDAEDLGDEGRPLAYMVKEQNIVEALWALAAKTSGLTILSEVELTDMSIKSGGVLLSLDDDRTLEAQLLIGCDGRQSGVRKLAGIGFPGHAYKSKGVVGTIKLATPHKGAARQVFLKSGPFAVLPLQDNFASFVWTQKTEIADALMKMDDQSFKDELAYQLDGFLGDFDFIGHRFAYPLGMRVADAYIKERVVLAGDAAHAIHPLGGQGLNLGLKDVAALVETLVEARHVGLDIGSMLALEPYQAWRRTDTVNMAMGMDLLERIFDLPGPIRGVAGWGMSLAGKSPNLRSLMTKEASGLSGDKVPALFYGDLISLD